MNASLITHADGRRFLREGECDGCIDRPGMTPGQCCTFFALPVSRAFTEDERAWLRLHDGVDFLGDSLNILVPIKCSALDDEGRCSLFGKPERPAMCERYPELPGQVLDGCAYTLTEVHS